MEGSEQDLYDEASLAADADVEEDVLSLLTKCYELLEDYDRAAQALVLSNFDSSNLGEVLLESEKVVGDVEGPLPVGAVCDVCLQTDQPCYQLSCGHKMCCLCWMNVLSSETFWSLNKRCGAKERNSTNTLSCQQMIPLKLRRMALVARQVQMEGRPLTAEEHFQLKPLPPFAEWSDDSCPQLQRLWQQLQSMFEEKKQQRKGFLADPCFDRSCPGRLANVRTYKMTDVSVAEMQCTDCHVVWCQQCKERSHWPLALCGAARYWQEKLFQPLMQCFDRARAEVERNLLKEISKKEDEMQKMKLAESLQSNSIACCPRCRTAIYKTGGCMHMKCTGCEHEFCWLCFQPWPHTRTCLATKESLHVRSSLLKNDTGLDSYDFSRYGAEASPKLRKKMVDELKKVAYRDLEQLKITYVTERFPIMTQEHVVLFMSAGHIFSSYLSPDIKIRTPQMRNDFDRKLWNSCTAALQRGRTFLAWGFVRSFFTGALKRDARFDHLIEEAQVLVETVEQNAVNFNKLDYGKILDSVNALTRFLSNWSGENPILDESTLTGLLEPEVSEWVYHASEDVGGQVFFYLCFDCGKRVNIELVDQHNIVCSGELGTKLPCPFCTYETGPGRVCVHCHKDLGSELCVCGWMGPRHHRWLHFEKCDQAKSVAVACDLCNHIFPLCFGGKCPLCAIIRVQSVFGSGQQADANIAPPRDEFEDDTNALLHQTAYQQEEEEMALAIALSQSLNESM